MSYFDDASLVMIPSGYKDQKVYSVKPIDGSGDLTFSRASNATRVNSSGLVEKVRTNEFLYSEDYSTTHGWFASTIGLSTVNFTSNYGIAPNGTTTADRIELHLNSEPYADYVRPTASFVVGVEYTYSIYLKSLSGTPTFEFFNDGAIGVNKTITTDWARYSYTFTATSATAYPRFLVLATTSPDVDVLAWGGQIETGVLTDYIATTTTAVSVGPVSGLPRLDYSGGASCPSLLLEPQRTNLIQFSEQFNNAWWSPSNSTISANAVTSPDGYTNADNIVENTATSTHGVGNLSGLTLTAAPYTFSVFVKKQTRDFFAISTYDGSSTLEGYFNLSTGAVATMPAGLTGTITNYGNGWYRCAVTRTMGANPNNYFSFNAAATDGGSTYTGTSATACSLFGGMLELGAYPSSYVNTLSSAVTRVADSASKTGISSLIGQTEGTLFAEFTFNSKEGNKMLMFASVAGSSSYAIYSHTFSTNSITFQVWNGTNQVGIDYTGLTDGQSVKIAGAYKANDFVFYLNGTQVGTDTSGSIPSGLSQLEIGGYNQAGSPYDWSKTIKQAVVFPTRLSNADLATLTTL